MYTVKTLASSALALLLLAGPAAAVTVKNTSDKEISIGVDYGAKEEVKNVAAGKSATFECKEGCGVTGPWGFSWTAKGEDSFAADGTSMVTAAEAKQREASVEQGTQDQTEEKRKKIVEEATSAVRETQNALKALDEGKTDEALAALERATGKLEIILARDPKLALAPESVTMTYYEFVGDADDVKKIREEARELLEEGRLQEARRMIRDLASEAVISVSNIPLATYPAAMKVAAKLIDEGKTQEAKSALQGALNTLVVVEETIVPLPVVIAEAQLEEAEKLTEKADRSAEDNKRLADLLKSARRELEYADALGYGTRKDFKDLNAQLSQIEKKTEGGQSGVGFFDSIKSSLAGLFKSSQSDPGAVATAPANKDK